jgi:O-antigen ligase
MRSLSLKIQPPFPLDRGIASLAAMGLLFVLAASLPPKWATLHAAGLLLVFALGFARREDWHSAPVRIYLLCTTLWLLPVLLTAALQHAQGVATAPPWSALPLLVLRMLGIGLGLIVLMQRGWLNLRGASFALLAALTLHAGAGLVEWLVNPVVGLDRWREQRLVGLVGNPNPFGVFMALTVILAVGLLRGPTRHSALWGVLAVALLGVFGSGSRGALLVTVCGLLVLFPPVGFKRGLLYLTAVVGAVVAYLLVDVPGATSSDDQRILALRFSLEQIRLAPWLGWGIDAYTQLPGRVGPAAPHNMLLDLAVSSGLPALAAWVVSTALLIFRLYRRRQSAAHLALALLAATVLAGVLEYSLLVSTHYSGIWVIVTTLACCTLGVGAERPDAPASLSN